MAILNLTDFGTRKVLRKYGLTAARKIGRGEFCAVYEDSPTTVLKLTADAIQLESVRDYLVGVHFPKLIENEGYVGEQSKGERSLFLFKAERLKPVREADPSTRKLARQVLKAVEKANSSDEAINRSNVQHTRFAYTQSLRAQATLELLMEDETLPASIREAFEDIHRMTLNYNDLVIDFHGPNLMVRGNDELVFNDVILDGELWYGRHKS